MVVRLSPAQWAAKAKSLQSEFFKSHTFCWHELKYQYQTGNQTKSTIVITLSIFFSRFTKQPKDWRKQRGGAEVSLWGAYWPWTHNPLPHSLECWDYWWTTILQIRYSDQTSALLSLLCLPKALSFVIRVRKVACDFLKFIFPPNNRLLFRLLHWFP